MSMTRGPGTGMTVRAMAEPSLSLPPTSLAGASARLVPRCLTSVNSSVISDVRHQVQPAKC